MAGYLEGGLTASGWREVAGGKWLAVSVWWKWLVRSGWQEVAGEKCLAVSVW